jgi:hypothetical protein
LGIHLLQMAANPQLTGGGDCGTIPQAKHTVSPSYKRGLKMTDLAQWLRSQRDRHNMSQLAASFNAGVGQATISGILKKGHVPRVDTLFRLADYFGADRPNPPDWR